MLLCFLIILITKGNSLANNIHSFSAPLTIHCEGDIQKPRKGKPSLKIDISGALADLDLVAKQSVASLPSVAVINRPILPPFPEPELEAWFSTCMQLLNKDFALGTALKRLSQIGGIEGANKSYVLGLNDEKLAIIKPLGEEVGLRQTPEGFSCLVKNGIESGTMGIREALAFKLFPHIVPPTTLSEITSTKFSASLMQTCSIQKFILNAKEFRCLSEDKISIIKDQLYPIISMDLILANADRHHANLLLQNVDSETPKVVPIDHGCILSANAISASQFCWLKYINNHEMLPVDECEKIRKINFDAYSLEIRKLLKKASYINTFAIHLLLAQNLCQTQTIRQLAMYQQQNGDDFFNESPLTHQILKMAALDAGFEFTYDLLEEQEVPLGCLHKAIIDVHSFIDEQTSGIDVFLSKFPLTREQKIDLLQNSDESMESYVKIDLVFGKTAEAINKLFLNNDKDAILQKLWKKLAHRAIYEDLIVRLQDLDKAFIVSLP
jgi:hypothetical protein